MSGKAPSWCVVGAEVVEFTPLYDGCASMHLTTVERVLRRDVVLANGERYRLPLLVKRGGHLYDPSTTLLPRSHDRVRAANRANRLRRLLNNADRAARVVQRDVTYENALRAEEAFGDLVDALALKERPAAEPVTKSEPKRAEPRPRRIAVQVDVSRGSE